jgi:hypothetical protein
MWACYRVEATTSVQAIGPTGLVLSCQQRATKCWVQILMSAAAECASTDETPTTAGEAENDDELALGDIRDRTGGRSRVIHMPWNGFLFRGAEPDDETWTTWFASRGRPA